MADFPTVEAIDGALEGYLFACGFEPLTEQAHRQAHRIAATQIHAALQGPEPESTVLAPALVYALSEGKRAEATSLLAEAIYAAVFQCGPGYHEDAVSDAAAIMAALLGEFDETKWGPFKVEADAEMHIRVVPK